MTREINFKLILNKHTAVLIEENNTPVLEFRASSVLTSEYLPDMLAGAITSRVREIISELIGGNHQ